jgi:glycosyltransferase involved in cell wall biosynthesis
MRITYLHQYFTTPDMAGGTRSFEMARRLVSMGHEVSMVTSDRSPDALQEWNTTIVEGIQVHWLGVRYSNEMDYPARIRAFALFALGSARRAAKIPGDIVFASSTPLTVAIPGAWVSRRLRIPMVFEVRDLWPEIPIAMGALRSRPLVWAARRLERYAYRNSAHVVALSPGMRDGIVRTGYPPQNVTVIPNAADVDFFDVGDGAGEEFRVAHPALGDKKIILYAGTVGRVNGLDYLVDVARHLAANRPDACIVVLGEGAETESVRAKARAEGVLDVNFHMLGSVPKSAVPKALAASSLTLSTVIDLPQLHDNSANKFFDSLAAGRPIAINHGGWLAGLIDEHDIGVVLPRDPGVAAEKLGRRLSDVGWLKAAGQRARLLARERFSRDDLARRLERVLERAVYQGREH